METPPLDVQHDYAARRKELGPLFEEKGIANMFLPIGADLEYLTGHPRRIPTFGEVNYAHNWVAGAFVGPDRDPVFVLPRNYVEFDLPDGMDGEVVVVNELDDGDEMFARAASSQPSDGRLAVGARTWGTTVIRLLELFPGAELVDGTLVVNRLRRIKSPDELVLMREACRIVDEAMRKTTDMITVGVTEMEIAEAVNHHLLREGARTWSFDTAVWSMGPHDTRDATVRLSHNPLVESMGVSFDFGAVYRGYCSDFGRTVHVGEPSGEYRSVYEIVMAAQEAGMEVAKPGALASEVHEATRKVIVEAGYGDWFRHRTGHCIGLDVHELPYISEEDDTPLEAGMTFTIEPSVFWPGSVGVRVEDVILCTANGCEKLNRHPTTMTVNV